MSDPLSFKERHTITFVGDSVSAQIRHDARGDYLALYALEEAELDVDRALVLREDDTEMLAALLAMALSRRGFGKTLFTEENE